MICTADVDYALELRGITKRFGGVLALNNASLAVRRGEVHGLVGQNGAGKSTLMRILDGFHPSGSYEGEVVIGGKPVELHSPADALRNGISIVPQETSVVELLSVAENILLGRFGSRFLVNPRELRGRAQEFLNEKGIPLDANVPVAQLTAGQKQLVMIARALYSNPQILILDEPTSALPRGEVRNLLQLVSRFPVQNVTCIFISHKFEEILQLCNRVSVLQGGQVVAEFPRAEFDHDRIVSAMIGRRLGDLYPERADSISGTGSVLEVTDLVVRDPNRPGRNAVDGVSFSVGAGEILGIAGLLGAGRSELLKALYGRLPSSGTVRIDGMPLTLSSPKLAMSRGIGFVTEDRKSEGLLFNLRLRENLTVTYLREMSHLVVLDRRREKALAEQAIEGFGIVTPSVNAPVSTLSGGNQQKVVLARALVRHPRILLLDEPTKGVDIGAKAEIYRLMTSLAVDGVAIILVSSEFPELLALSHRFIVLAAGRVRDTCDATEASEERLLRGAMLSAA